MTINQLQNDIITEMSPYLDLDQLTMLHNILAQKLKNVTIECTDLTIGSDKNSYYIKTFIACKTLEGMALSTLRQYAYGINKFINEMGIDVTRATTEHIRTYLAQKMINGISKSTVNTYRAYLSSFYEWMFMEKYIDRNIVAPVKKIKVEFKQAPTITDIELEQIKHVCSNYRETALIDLLECTGMRCIEVTRLKVSDIDYEHKRIQIFGKGSKYRYVGISPRLCVSLKLFLDNRGYESPYVFCNTKGKHDKINTSCIERCVKKIAKRAGIDEINVHRFRHHFCTNLIKRGMEIQEVSKLMGHSSIQTTYKYYTHLEVDNTLNNFMKYCA